MLKDDNISLSGWVLQKYLWCSPMKIWATEVGIGVKNNSTVDFKIFTFIFFLHTLVWLCVVFNWFSNIFPTKNLHFLLFLLLLFACDCAP